MTYQEFLEQTSLEVWWLWNSGEVSWRGSIPQEPRAYAVCAWAFGRDVWDLVEAKYGKYGRNMK